MQDWQRVIEERRRIQQMTQKAFDYTSDRNKIERQKSDRKKTTTEGGINKGGGILEGICYWTICGDFVVSSICD